MTTKSTNVGFQVSFVDHVVVVLAFEGFSPRDTILTYLRQIGLDFWP